MPRTTRFDAKAYARDQLRSRILPSDPVEWTRDKTGVNLWSKQREISYSVQKNQLTAVKSGHGVGKSFTTSNLASWWVDTHPVDDTLVVSTAPSSRQVGAIMWEEIRKIHRKAGLAGEVQRANRWLIDDVDGSIFGDR
jgi:reverse gyrase